MQNNNQSMATVTETFFIEETMNLVHDNEALKKWNDKCEELGLEGQKQIVSEDKSPIPFLWMNTALIATFETLCPTKVNIEKYSKTPIPVEILELVSLSNKESYFDFVQIWYNDKVKDPVCIGFKVDDEYKGKDGWYLQHYSQKYLLGRWADVKASLDQLIDRAKKLFIRNETLELNQQIKDRQRKLEDLETEAENKFGNAMPVTNMLF